MFMPINYRQEDWPIDSHELLDRTREFAPWTYEDGDIVWPETGEAIIKGCPAEIAEQIIEARAQFAEAVRQALNVPSVTDHTAFVISNVDEAAQVIGGLRGTPEFKFENDPSLCRQVFSLARNQKVTAGQIRKILEG